ncbi:restriction endonuclease PLD domain-containing protein [Lactococcus allomyrinae]|uniref:NgoFVII family restriction endonuclease n=1 Tax=Lactococcus allomyrinae TaxID=2419773 RepID=A0A387BKT9_9LACT|nr:restriction endonuclease PLD domain-containing protein [Lactococcus allomyrinae]AYG01626.1 NgoFVII family restriction endonuclease [Lactococcus allomyrinae]
MLYYTGLEDIIFSKHELLSAPPDELIIISGYLGPAPVERLSELPNIKITVIGGMYSSGIDARLLNSLNNSKNNNSSLTIKYARQEIHSKIYIWKKNGKILSALIGSANFSSKGLRTDYRESLADATRDTFNPLNIYFNFINEHSEEEPIINKKQEIIEFTQDNHKVTDVAATMLNKKFSFEIPLYSSTKEKGKFVPLASGLNWGRARLTSNAHVAKGDAYIRLPKSILKQEQQLIKPFDSGFTTPEGERKRNSDPIELIWDDGTTMEASLEGVQKFNGRTYPKQLASYTSKRPFQNGKPISKKSILGRYIRKRLGVNIDDEITMKTLELYGRDTITLSLIEEGVYYADFSV